MRKVFVTMVHSYRWNSRYPEIRTSLTWCFWVTLRLTLTTIKDLAPAVFTKCFKRGKFRNATNRTAFVSTEMVLRKTNATERPLFESSSHRRFYPQSVRNLLAPLLNAALGGFFAIGMVPGSVLQAFGQPVRPTADWARCVEELELPTDPVMLPFYPGTTTVNASVNFGYDGKPAVVVNGGNKSVRDAVTVALEASRYRGKLCAGKSVAFVFTFIIQGTPTRDAYPPRTVLKPPNQFLLYFHPRLPIEELAPPAPPKPSR
jgi:hypothetical protein